MIRAVRAELFKLRTSPGPWVVLCAVLAFSALGIVFTFLVAKGAHHLEFVAPHTQYRLRRLMGAGFVAGGVWMGAIVGVLSVTGEYRHKLMTQSLLVEPRRWKLLLAKTLGTALWGVFYAVASLLMVGAMGIPLLVTQGGSLSSLFDQAGAVLPGYFAGFALLALFGAGLGTLIKNQIAAVVTILAITFIIEPIIDGVVPNAGKWLPLAASASIAGGLVRVPDHGALLGAWVAAVVLAGWALVPIVVGYFATFKRDVT